MRVCYFGKYDPEYDRNAIIRAGLEANGVSVLECRIEQGYLAQQYISLWRACHRTNLRGAHAIIAAEFNHFVVPLAWWFALRWGIPLLVDPLVSRYDMNVYDRRFLHPHSWRARRQWWIDWLAFHLAHILIADTHLRFSGFITPVSTCGIGRCEISSGGAGNWATR
ncbi:MAG TPA: hypothetical protein EYP49_00700 [Anaerolineae bacterium]|nr:hypothetical protein [Anaerolineae bacterium]